MATDLPPEPIAATSRMPLARHSPTPAVTRSSQTSQGSHPQSYKAVFYLTAAFFFSATLLRSTLTLGEGVRGQTLLLLGAWLALFFVEELFFPHRAWLFGLYLIAQTTLVVALLSLPASRDFFAVLFAVLSMQVVRRWPLRPACVCIGLFAPLSAVGIMRNYDLAPALISTLTYFVVDCFAAYYAWSSRRAEEERERTESLASQLREANRGLRAHSERIERLTIERERSRMARELHDSVTQTICAMSLAARSLMLLPVDDRVRLDGQLRRLTLLANNALAEMRVLIAELHPEKTVKDGLAVALRRHLDGHTLPDGLQVTLHVDGDGSLTAVEEQGLLRIAQEALNNVAKHATTSQASVRLRLREPFRLEIGDQGQGFDPDHAGDGMGMGLANMQERAAEIGWKLEILSEVGKGTVVRAEKSAAGARRAP
jgi:signal transduction histidine kinase